MRHTTETMTAALLGAAAWMVLGGAMPAAAMTATVDNECVQACIADEKACSDPVRDAARTCREEAGCDTLADTARTLCMADHASDECAAARAAVHECVAPCREAQKTEMNACREAALTCLRDECGLEGLPPPPRCHGGPRPHSRQAE